MRKVLVFHQSGSIGGAGVSLAHILKSIDRKNNEVTVVCPRNPNEMSKEIKSMGIRVIETDGTPVLFPHYSGGIKYACSFRTILNLVSLAKDKSNVIRIIKDEQPNIVIVNSMTLAYIGKYVKKNKHISTICFDRETFQRGLIGARTSIIKKWMSSYFDVIVFISKHDCSQIKRCKGKKKVIYDKVDLSLFEHEKKKMNAARVLYLGGISRLKGIHVLLGAVDSVKHKNVEFLLVGEGEKVKKKCSIADRLRAILHIGSLSMARVAYSNCENKERVVFLPATMTPEKYYVDADIVVFPSTAAHQARPVFEAGAARVPIIISDFCETSEFCRDNENVILFRPNDSVCLAKKIDYILENNSIIGDIIESNYLQTKNDHNLCSLPKEINEMLNEL